MKIAFITAALSAISLHAAPLPPAKELARNEVLAFYKGTKEIPCRHMTAQCPDRCGHASTVAIFEVGRNLKYSKNGEYGDAKAEANSLIYVDIKKDIEGQSPDVAKFIKTLKPAALVHMTQVHYYVTKDGSSYPVRPVVSIAPKLTCSTPPPNANAPKLTCSGPPQD